MEAPCVVIKSAQELTTIQTIELLEKFSTDRVDNGLLEINKSSQLSELSRNYLQRVLNSLKGQGETSNINEANSGKPLKKKHSRKRYLEEQQQTIESHQPEPRKKRKEKKV
jgi:hypothetical protein